ncbi:MAG: NifU family protein [Myxococcota bacterium]
MGRSDAQSLRQAVERVLDRLRPALVADGGDVELVQVDGDGTVQVALLGSCATCPAQLATLRYGLEARLREEIPQVEAVVPVRLQSSHS